MLNILSYSKVSEAPSIENSEEGLSCLDNWCYPHVCKFFALGYVSTTLEGNAK